MRKDEAKFITEFLSEAGTKAENSDFFGYVLLDNYAIWVVADGFDEENGAKIAAKTAVESVIEYFMLRPRFNYEVIKEMMDYANLKIFSYAHFPINYYQQLQFNFIWKYRKHEILSY